jgi:hypothetical protein
MYFARGQKRFFIQIAFFALQIFCLLKFKIKVLTTMLITFFENTFPTNLPPIDQHICCTKRMLSCSFIQSWSFLRFVKDLGAILSPNCGMSLW